MQLGSTLGSRWIGALCLGLLTLLVQGPVRAEARPGFTLEPMVIKSIVDGDTVHGVNARGKTIKVRMHGMDTPELHLMTGAGTFGQLPWAERAEKALAQMVRPGDSVVVKNFGNDKYGRMLGQVLFDEKNLNLEQVRLGQAVSYAICGAGNCTEELLKEQGVAEFAEACRKAQSEQIGIFDPALPLTEMPFEFRLRIQKRKADKFVGNLRTHEYVMPDQCGEIPVCERIFFLSEEDAKSLGYQLKGQS